MFFGSKAKLAFEKSNKQMSFVSVKLQRINLRIFNKKLIFDVSLGGQKTKLLHCPLLAL